MSERETNDRGVEREVFLGAIEKPTPEERSAYLDGACGKDASLRQRVEDLLAKHFQESSFMNQPAAERSSTLVVPISETPGTVIDRYKLLEKLGEGGFGAVYVAEQKEPVRRRVALKIIKLGMDTRQVIARFEAERQALALMDHPNIAKVLDAGATETGRPYFVMELVRGVPITKYCDENKASILDRLNLFIAVCQAIQHAHQKGIIHRDIKPSNILVTLHDGVPVPKVIDFGIAKATHSDLTDKTIYTQFQQFIGTPAYISPEQAEMSGLDLDTRSDIYSLGVLLYELLTSKTPLDAETLVSAGLDEMRRAIREVDPPRPSTRLSTLAMVDATNVAKHHNATPDKLAAIIRGDLDWIVMKCLEKDRTRRYDAASGIAADLKRYLNNEPVIARPPSNTYRFYKFVRRHKRAVAAASAVALALIVGLSFATFAFLRERQARLNQAAAEKAKQVETVRADAVADFMKDLLSSTAPELLRQGHQRPVRDLLKAADELASTGLSNAPAAELQLRDLMSGLYINHFLDSPEAYQQVKRVADLLPNVPDEKLRITQLLSSVPDDRLPAPRDEYRIRAAIFPLWAGHTEGGLTELNALKDEFRRRTPPDERSLALCLFAEGNWAAYKGDTALAERSLTEALRLFPADSPPLLSFGIRLNLIMALTDRGAAAEAEKVAREGLIPPANVTPDMAEFQVGLLSKLADTLCHQRRFAEAESLLREQKRELSVQDGSPHLLLALDKKFGDVLARAGNSREALPVLMSVATNSLGTASDCVLAACVAIGSGDLESYRRMCAIGLARFAAGAEGLNALNLASVLLAAPQDELMIQIADDMLGVKETRDLARELEVGIRQWLQLRKGQPAEAAALWPRTTPLPPPTTIIIARLRKAGYVRAINAFWSAVALGQLGRTDEARRAYADGMKELGPAASPDKPRDLGDNYGAWYFAETHRREASQLFKAKGIVIPTE